MHFEIRVGSAARHELEITLQFLAQDAETQIQVPYWRPGRYEAGNFPRNYIGFDAQAGGQAIAFRKMTSHSWLLLTPVGQTITVQYTLRAAELTAGNTYCDSEVILINPVNALVFIPGRERDAINLDMELPQDWEIATTLQARGGNGAPNIHSFVASSFDELMDSPIFSAPDLNTYEYTSHGIPFYIHVSGYTPIESSGIIADFKAFTDVQIAAFGAFPGTEYHFHLLFLPSNARHGVEHKLSTVIIMGPVDQIDHEDMYHSLLGIASHELYHVWNVKNLRPVQLTPYNLNGPDFFRLGYVVEGVTTYMGDLMLWQASLLDDDDFLLLLSEQWQRHLDNPGRFNLSLADASIDTWVDGYGSTPERRVSIYTEGALLALVCDVWILDATQGQSHLNTAMRNLYDLTDPAVGYTEDAYWNELEKLANAPWGQLRASVLDGRGALESYVIDALNKLGLQATEAPDTGKKPTWWGCKLLTEGTVLRVLTVYTGTPAEAAGLCYGQLIETIDGMPASEFLAQASSNYLRSTPVTMHIKDGYRSFDSQVIPDGNPHLYIYRIEKASPVSNNLFQSWKNQLNMQNT